MCGHDRLNTQRVELLHDLIQRVGLEFLHNGQQATRLCFFASSQVVPATTYAVNFFCQIDHLEVGGKSPHQTPGFGDIHSCE